MSAITRNTRKLSRLTDKELALNFLLTEWQAAYSLVSEGTGTVVESLQHQIVKKCVRLTKHRDKVRKQLLKMANKLNLN